MKSDRSDKTGARHSDAGTSSDAEPNKILEKGEVEQVERAVARAAEPDQAKPGRPKGAKNKRTDELRLLQEGTFGMTVGELLTATLFDGIGDHLKGGGSPGTFMEERAREMGRRLQIPAGKAFEHVKAMADDLMPYVHQKMPVALEADGKGLMIAVFSPDGGFASPTQRGGLDLRPANVRRGGADQGTIEGDFEAKSDGDSRTDEE